MHRTIFTSVIAISLVTTACSGGTRHGGSNGTGADTTNTGGAGGSGTGGMPGSGGSGGMTTGSNSSSGTTSSGTMTSTATQVGPGCSKKGTFVFPDDPLGFDHALMLGNMGVPAPASVPVEVVDGGKPVGVLETMLCANDPSMGSGYHEVRWTPGSTNEFTVYYTGDLVAIEGWCTPAFSATNPPGYDDLVNMVKNTPSVGVFTPVYNKTAGVVSPADGLTLTTKFVVTRSASCPGGSGWIVVVQPS